MLAINFFLHFISKTSWTLLKNTSGNPVIYLSTGIPVFDLPLRTILSCQKLPSGPATGESVSEAPATFPTRPKQWGAMSTSTTGKLEAQRGRDIFEMGLLKLKGDLKIQM